MLQIAVNQRSSETFFQFGANKDLGNEFAFEETALPYFFACQWTCEIQRWRNQRTFIERVVKVPFQCELSQEPQKELWGHQLY